MDCINYGKVNKNENAYNVLDNNDGSINGTLTESESKIIISDNILDKYEISIKLSDDDYNNLKVIKVENNIHGRKKYFTQSHHYLYHERLLNLIKIKNIIAEYLKTKFRNVKDRVSKCLKKVGKLFKGRRISVSTGSEKQKTIRIYIHLPWNKIIDGLNNDYENLINVKNAENSDKSINTNCIVVNLEGIKGKTPISFIINLNKGVNEKDVMNNTDEYKTDGKKVINNTDLVQRALCNRCLFDISHNGGYTNSNYVWDRENGIDGKHEVVAKEWEIIEEIDEKADRYYNKAECKTNRYDGSSSESPSVCTTKREISNNILSLPRYINPNHFRSQPCCYTAFIPILDFPINTSRESILNTSRSFENLARELNNSVNTYKLDKKSIINVDDKRSSWYNNKRNYNSITEKFCEEPKLGYFHPLFVLHGPAIIDGKESVLVVSSFEEIHFEAPKFLFAPTKTFPANMEYIVSGPCIINKTPKGVATSIDGQVAYFDLPIFPPHYWYYEFETPRENLKFDKNGIAIGFKNVQISNLLSYNGIKSAASEEIRELLNNFKQLPLSDQNCLKNILGTEELEPFVLVDIPMKYGEALRSTELDCTIHPHYFKQIYIRIPLDTLIDNGFDPENLDLKNKELIDFVTNHGIIRKKIRLSSPVYNFSPLLYSLEMQIPNDLMSSGEVPLAHFRFIPNLRKPIDNEGCNLGNNTIGISIVDELMERKESGFIRIPHLQEMYKVQDDNTVQCIDLNGSEHNPIDGTNGTTENETNIVEICTNNNVENCIDIDNDTCKKVVDNRIRCMCGTLGRTCPYMSILRPTDFTDPSNFLKVYGDPLCDLVECSESNISVKQTDSLNPDGEWSAPIVGRNGNWRCYDCGNVNFPRRTKCNKCSTRRPSDGDKIVLQYVIRVHSELVRRIVVSKQRSRTSNHKQTGQLSLPLSSPRQYNRTGLFRGFALGNTHKMEKKNIYH